MTDSTPRLPEEPIHRAVAPLARFLHVEAASGVVLLASALAALALANSPLSEAFLSIWKTELRLGIGSFEMSHSLRHWINDGLMSIFFFVIGLEVKREFAVGELRDVRQAALPIAAAFGGMVAPAAVYLGLQLGEAGESGWGIPMATDIAFVVGCLALLGSRVPPSLRVLLLSLAIADDIGAIGVIALGYTETLNPWALGLAALGIGATVVLERLGVRRLPVYALMGLFIWFAAHESGVHATIAGVLLGLMTPARSYVSEGLFAQFLERASGLFEGGGWDSVRDRATRVRRFRLAARETLPPLEYLEAMLHPWVSFAIMPLFAFANAGVEIELADLGDPIATAVLLGLVVGKPLGIVGASAIAVRLGLARLPEGVDWGVVMGGGFLSGIGFTMALFIAGLALEGAALDAAKVGVLAGSAISTLVGITLLVWQLPEAAPATSS